MHRFRKKSDAKRVPLNLDSARPSPLRPVPTLPPADDFRTSLILPDLTRRFSVLQQQSGRASLEGLREGFAEQRARGAPNAVTEEEEQVILDALSGMRSSARANNEHDSSSSAASTGNDSPGRYASASAPRSTRVNKRHSNNLFGNGAFRDETYARTLPRQLSARSAASSSSRNGPSYRSTTPDNSRSQESTTSPTSSPESSESPELPSSYGGNSSSSGNNDTPPRSAAHRLSRSFNPTTLKRVSQSLDEVLSRLEEAEDEVLVPRTGHAHHAHESPRSHALNGGTSTNTSASSLSLSIPSSAPQALSADRPISADSFSDAGMISPVPRSGATSPTPRLPGYIPGMPRPATPRNHDVSDDLRSHSTTPRAGTPASPSPAPLPPSALRRGSVSSRHRSGSDAASPAFKAQSFIHRSTTANGRHTPDADSSFSDFGSPSRARAASPLSGSAPYTIASGTGSSRPTTPSNVTWVPKTSPAQHTRNGSAHSSYSAAAPTHSRSGSWASLSGGARASSDLHGSGMAGNGIRTLRSPPLPDSVTTDARATPQPPSELGAPFVLAPAPTYRSVTPARNTLTSFGGAGGNSARSSNLNSSASSLQQQQQQQNASGSTSAFALALGSPRIFSPIAGGSSRSSLVSESSSYHSWDGDEKERDRGLELLRTLEPPAPVWHESIPGSEKTGDEVEAVVKQYTQLTFVDFVAIQEKLLEAAQVKSAPQEMQRTPSLRRRRPSASRSNYSFSAEKEQVSPRGASKPARAEMEQQQQQPVFASSASPDRRSEVAESVPKQSANAEKLLKKNALLESMVSDLHSSTVEKEEPALPPAVIVQSATASSFPGSSDPLPNPQSILSEPATADPSSPERRNRDLARELFGFISDDKAEAPASDKELSLMDSNTQTPSSLLQLSAHSFSPSLSHGQDSSTGSHSSHPVSPAQDQETLAVEIQRRAEAATAALRKTPSVPKFQQENGGNGAAATATTPKKPIRTRQISTPRLEFASSSMETIPLAAAAAAASPNTSKIGNRFKRLGGTLRAKKSVPTGEEVSPFPLDLRPSPASSSATHNTEPPSSSTLQVPAVTQPVSAAEPSGRFKTTVPSPPASAGPTFKGFMARFRKQRSTDKSPEQSPARSTQPLTPHRLSPEPTSSGPPSRQGTLSSSQSRGHGPSSTPPTEHTGFAVSSSTDVVTEQGVLRSSPVPMRQPLPPSSHESASSASGSVGSMGNDEAIKQLFAAASNLGLDEGAINELLSRSGSISSARSPLGRNASLASRHTATARPSLDSAVQMPMTPIITESRPSTEGYTYRSVPPADGGRLSTDVFRPSPPKEEDGGLGRKMSTRARSREEGSSGDRKRNTVIRRTVIFPSDPRFTVNDITALLQRNPSSRQRKRASTSSIQSKHSSVHDRAPTPPPNRAVAVKRFSVEPSPPVPRLPAFLASQADNGFNLSHSAPPTQSIPSSSIYDSLYEIYADSGNSNATQSHNQPTADSEARPAIEVIELENGETVWSIVNGLREDEDEYYLDNRASFTSEYDFADSRAPSSENVRLFIKEHGRNASKGSTASFVSRRSKRQPEVERPQTKVFYSSSAQIARLIESLSRGMDAGSFNILPSESVPGTRHQRQQSGTSSSEHYTMEERVDRMLASVAKQ